MTNLLPLIHRMRLLLVVGFCCAPAIQGTSWAQAMVAEATPPFLDAPQPQPAAGQVQNLKQMVFTPLTPARKYAQVIEPYRAPYRLSGSDKLIFSLTELARPITIVPSLYSATYEQIFNSDPKYGHDVGAFGEKFGASMLRRATMRVFSDGLFAEAFHQDPRYYRLARGSIVHRSLLAMSQSVIRRGDDGEHQFNYSGIAGRAVSAALTVTYYPQPSVTASGVGKTFAYSVVTDAGGNLLLEFLPNLIRRFPVMEKLRLE